jgi:hypothetical protein
MKGTTSKKKTRRKKMTFSISQQCEARCVTEALSSFGDKSYQSKTIFISRLSC